jgi:hypothetical protein
VENSREFSLALECCRGAFPGGEGAQKTGIPESLDWPAFLRLVQLHRVQGLVWRGIARAGDIPAQIAEELSEEAAMIAAANLRALAESRELLSDFESAGVSLLFVKGLTLGSLAYGDIAIKSGVDIDLLVGHAQLAQAAQLLSNRGYRLDIPAERERLDAWHRLRKESVWSNPERKIQIDLHTRLADNPSLIPGIGIESPAQQVEVADGIELPTLAPDELFAYLAVHGASSAWFRLKWITDFTALLQRSSENEVDRLYLRSQELGAGRAAAQALLLSGMLYGGLSGSLRRELARDRTNRWLAEMALRQLRLGSRATEPTERRFGTAAIHLSQLALLPGIRFKLSELARQARVALP